MKYIYDEEKNAMRPIKDESWVRLPKRWLEGLDIKSGERWVLVVLKSYKGKEGLICPSLRTLSVITGLSLRQTAKTIRKLEKLGKIKIIKTKGKYNTYKILC